jgi:aromatic ring hydroxylase
MDGNAYIASLNDGRRLYWQGERIEAVGRHPAFQPFISKIAETMILRPARRS